MKNLSLIITLFIFIVKVNAQTIIFQEDFEDDAVANLPTSTAAYPYQIDANGGTCDATDLWEVAATSTFTFTNGSGNRAQITYGPSTCYQTATMVVGSFTPTVTSVDIEFDYGYSDGSTDDFQVILWNKTDNVAGATLIATTNTGFDGNFTTTATVISGKEYEIRFRYRGTDEYGVSVDNIEVSYVCSPTATITRTCYSDLTYDVSVEITDLNGASGANVKAGATTYHSSVGVGTYTITGLSGSNTISVVSVDNSGCFQNEAYGPCDLCTSISAPADLVCDAPLLDLSQPFYGSTACGYTVTTSGPSNFSGSSDNDSWLKFIPTSDSVVLDWGISGDADPGGSKTCTGSIGSSGIQIAVFDGSCLNEDAMTQLDVVNPTGPVGTTGSFDFNGLTVGQEYFLYIDGFAGDECEYYWEPVTGIAVLPPNDTCPVSSNINCGDRDTASIILATATGKPTGCTGGGTTGKGVWYTIAGSGSDITVSTDNSETNFDTQINIYSGSCNSLSCVAADDDSGAGQTSEVTFTATSGITYYIYVDGDESPDGGSSSEGQFEISLSCVACPADAGAWD